MPTHFALLSGVYLFVVLHLLFFLVVREQNIIALGLLISFFVTLFILASRKAPSKLSHSTKSERTSRPVENANPHDGGHVEKASPSTVKRQRGESELLVRTSTTIKAPHCQDRSPSERVSMPERDIAVTLHGSASREHQPSFTLQYSLVQEAEEEVRVIVPTRGICGDGGCCFEESVESSTATGANQERTVDAAHSHHRHHHHAMYSSLNHAGWVWATAVVSLLSMCTSIILLLVVSQSAMQSEGETCCSAPAWAHRAIQRTLLCLFTGICAEQDGVCMRDFFVTIVSLSVVGVLSIGQTLCGTVLRCRPCTRSPAGCQLEKISDRIGTWLVKMFTLAPLSLLWICIAGVGQGTLFGCVYVLLAVLLALDYPRCVLQRRRRRWLLYVVFLLLLSTVQACLRLPWLRESVEVYAATLSSAPRRLFLMSGLLSRDTTTTATTVLRWRVVQAVGAWWAGVECFCLHTHTYVTSVAAPRWAHNCEAAQNRALYRQALASKERNQLACAVEHRQAAQRKVEELRLQRGCEAMGARSEHRQTERRYAVASNPDLASLPDGPDDRTGNNVSYGEGSPYDRRHSPFGSGESYRCSIDNNHLTAHSTQKVHGSRYEPCATFSGSRGSWSPARAPFVNSSGSNRCESGSQRTLRTPLLSQTPSFEKKQRQRASGYLLGNSRSNHRCSHNGDGLAEDEEREMDLFCPSATAATAKLVEGDVVARYSPEMSDTDSTPARVSQRWAREPTKSPERTTTEESENADPCLHLWNASPTSRFFSAPKTQTPVAATLALSGKVSATPIQRPCGIPSSTNFLHADEYQQQDVIHRIEDNIPRGFSPFHSVASVMTAGVSPIESDLDRFATDGPPAVDTTALAQAEAVEVSAHAASLHSAKQAVAAIATATSSTGDRKADGGSNENGSPRTCCLQIAASKAFKTLHRELKTYLSTHTLHIVGEKEGEPRICRNGSCTHAQTETVVADPPAAASREPQESSLAHLLIRYVLQHWVSLCALLSLIHFTVSSTAVNLVLSLAGLVYVLLLRPWPPRRYVRLEVIFAAVIVVGKCLLRALLLSAAAPTVSSTTARCLNALFLTVRTSSAPSAASPFPSSSSTVSILLTSWESWFDIMTSVVFFCAVVIQWSLVYSDQDVLGCGCRANNDGSGNNVEEGLRDAPPFPSPLQTIVGTHPDIAAQDVESGLHHHLDKNCARRSSRWNRHRRGAGADYYAIQFFFDLLSLVLFCWAYYVIAPEDTAPSQDNLFYALQHNRLPGIFVATALGLVVVLFIERIIYVLRALVAKYVLHVILALTYHALYLIWYAVRDSSNSSSVASTALIALLMTAKLASLWCGALQLRHGYPLHSAHDPFTIKTDVVHWLGHMIFRAVPFLLELRVLLDWSFSATALKVQHWMLLEDIHHNVYRRYVDMRDLHWTSRHQGRRFPYYVRIYQGMFSFVAILLVLFFPLFWYSTFGPQVHAGQVTAWTSEVAFGGLAASPFYRTDAVLSTTTFRTVVATSIGNATPNPSSLLRFASASDTWQFAQASRCSSQMWSYTPAALSQLVYELQSAGKQKQKRQAVLVLRNRVTRSRSTDASYTTCDFEESYTLPALTALTFARALELWQAADSNGTTAILSPAAVSLPSFYTAYAVSSGSSVASMSRAGLVKVDCAVTLHHVGQYRGFTCLECATSAQSSTAVNKAATMNAAQTSVSSSLLASSASSNDRVQKIKDKLIYVVASTDVTTVQSSLSLIPNVGIITLYTSFILVMSTYVRNIFAGDAHRVALLQLANPEPVAELLRYIYLTRSSANNGQVGDLVLEQLLFLELLDLLRSPERLLALGGRRAEDYVREVYREDLYALTKRPFDVRG